MRSTPATWEGVSWRGACRAERWANASATDPPHTHTHTHLNQKHNNSNNNNNNNTTTTTTTHTHMPATGYRALLATHRRERWNIGHYYYSQAPAVCARLECSHGERLGVLSCERLVPPDVGKVGLPRCVLIPESDPGPVCVGVAVQLGRERAKNGNCCDLVVFCFLNIYKKGHGRVK